MCAPCVVFSEAKTTSRNVPCWSKSQQYHAHGKRTRTYGFTAQLRLHLATKTSTQAEYVPFCPVCNMIDMLSGCSLLKQLSYCCTRGSLQTIPWRQPRCSKRPPFTFMCSAHPCSNQYLQPCTSSSRFSFSSSDVVAGLLACISYERMDKSDELFARPFRVLHPGIKRDCPAIPPLQHHAFPTSIKTTMTRLHVCSFLLPLKSS